MAAVSAGSRPCTAAGCAFGAVALTGSGSVELAGKDVGWMGAGEAAGTAGWAVAATEVLEGSDGAACGGAELTARWRSPGSSAINPVVSATASAPAPAT
ncbi:MAG: hypothetical protein K0S06_1015 [Microvirga sp.]|jgi:hypothetical protein|nr:hypothetical protein [Microvirga sp.]